VELVNQHALAALLRRSRASLVAWAKLGMPVAQRGGPGRETLYNPVVVAEWLKATGRGQRPELAPMAMTVPTEPEIQTSGHAGGAAAGELEELPPPAGSDPHGYLEARAQREKTQAKLIELEYLQRVGALTSTDEVRRETAAIWADVAQQIRTLPHQLDAKLTSEPDYARRQRIWDHELHDFLARLSAHISTEGAS